MFDAKVTLEKFSEKTQTRLKMVLTCNYSKGGLGQPRTRISKTVTSYHDIQDPKVVATVADAGTAHGELHDRFYNWIGQAVYQDFEVIEKWQG